MKEIKLTQGLVSLVDDEDYDYLNQFKWYALKGRSTFYAIRNMRTSEFSLYEKRGTYSMHNVIMGIKGVDHINGYGLDNQRSNLRICTQHQNNMNSSSRKNSTSKYKGVSWANHMQKWRGAINFNRKSNHLGYFTSETEAALAYDCAAR